MTPLLDKVRLSVFFLLDKVRLSVFLVGKLLITLFLYNIDKETSTNELAIYSFNLFLHQNCSLILHSSES